MRIAFFFSLILLISILITSCDKAEGLLDPTYFFGKFHGITYTDNQGNIIKEDPNDWHYDKETNRPFFSTSIEFKPAYPNPISVDSYITLEFSIPEDNYAIIYIESEQGVVRYLTNNYFATGYHQFIYNLKDENGQSLQPGVYRCFMEAKGETYFGDIWIKEEY